MPRKFLVSFKSSCACKFKLKGLEREGGWKIADQWAFTFYSHSILRSPFFLKSFFCYGPDHDFRISIKDCF